MAHKDEIDRAVLGVLDRGRYILDGEVDLFEKEFGAYLGGLHTIGVASGTDALVLALKALDVGPGDVVFTVSHTAVATVAAIVIIGAHPVFVDIDPRTFTMDPNHLEELLQKPLVGKPKAVVPVHLYGRMADMPSIIDIAGQYELPVIEDCAQAHGAMLHGRKAGSWGHAGAFSFYPTKNLGAFGDGGAVVTHSRDLANKVRMLRQYGWRERFVSEIAGYNSRLDEMQAAVLRVKLKYLDNENGMRIQYAHQYRTGLASLDLVLPEEHPGETVVYHQFVVRLSRRDSLLQFLKSRNIGCAVHYPIPVHLQPAFRTRRNSQEHPLPVTEQVCSQILSLPMYPYMGEERVETVIRAVRDFVKGENTIA
jgi:dTDP-4-amino-4,6-dideoxygalactose transaminase